MKQYIIRRDGYSLLSLFLLSVTIFLFVRVTGDPAAPAGRTRRQRGRHRGDAPPVRPRSAAVGAVLAFHGQPARRAISASPSTITRRCMDLYFQRLPNSLLLAAVAMALSLLIGIPSGILAAVRVGRFWDSAGKIFALLGLSLPSVLGRAGADPGVLGLPRLAAVLGLRHAAAPAHAGLHAGLVFRRRAHAADALLDARGAGLGVHQAGAAQGPAARRW